MEERKIYEDIALRTEGDVYVGVVGPVRTGKSTLIKRFMEALVLPNMENTYRRERARDELPQSGSGRTIMTAEPKFIPEEAVEISLDESGSVRVRLVDCVGYMVDGAAGQTEDDAPRMVMTPWFDHEIPMTEAAEIGTRKVIAEHSTIGLVVTTDGTITEIPRESYIEPERRVIDELKELGKPFVVLLNSAQPQSERAQAIRAQIEAEHNVTCLAVNCLELAQSDITDIIRDVLYEFPMRELDLFLPPWVDALEGGHPVKSELYDAIRGGVKGLRRIRDVRAALDEMAENSRVTAARVEDLDLGTGVAEARLELPRELFYETLSDQTGFTVADDGDLMSLLTRLAKVNAKYAAVADALDEVERTGYGIVVPSPEAMTLEEPEIMRQGGRYGVRLRASAPSIHMIRADVKTEVAPIVGTEKQSEEMVNYLLQEFEGDTGKIWQSNIFGKSFHELVSEDLNTKLKRMPEDAQNKLRETLQRIINEGSGGLICIIL